MPNTPLILADLDDTLFQTMRKLGPDAPPADQLAVGAYDREMKPRSFMTAQQSMLVNWMLEHAELIPVTARGTEEISRVAIKFKSWAVTTHGAVILTPDGTPDEDWQAFMLARLVGFHDRIQLIQETATALFRDKGIDAWARINFEYGKPIYLVMKHRSSAKLDELYSAGAELESLVDTEGFYIHRNSNNIAWLPHCVEKGLAVEFLLAKLSKEQGARPVIGLGDSLSDHRFLRHCSWWGVPQQSQFAGLIESTLDL